MPQTLLIMSIIKYADIFTPKDNTLIYMFIRISVFHIKKTGLKFIYTCQCHIKKWYFNFKQFIPLSYLTLSSLFFSFCFSMEADVACLHIT